MKWFKRKTKEKSIPLKEGNIYVVDAGTYAGEYLVLMEIDCVNDNLKFMTLPDFIKRDMSFDIFNRGLSYKVVNFLETLPKNVFKTCKQQYENINTNI
jgi:hypothetical protein